MVKSLKSTNEIDRELRLDATQIALSVKRLSRDKRFSVIARRMEQPVLTYSTNAFRALARAIIHQQLSTKAALTIEQRFTALYRPKKFPAPVDVASTPLVQLRSVGLSGQKSGYLYDLAQKFIDGTVNPKQFHNMTNEEIATHVISVKGIAQWSADMFLIFALNRRNVLPVGDLGVKKGAQLFFKLPTLPTSDELLLLATPFDGDYTVFTLYLWKLADEAKIKNKK